MNITSTLVLGAASAALILVGAAPAAGAATPAAAPEFRTVSYEVPAAYESFDAPIVAPDGYTIKLRDYPGSSGATVANLAHGQHVRIICTTRGSSVTSAITGMTSTLWDGVAVGNSGTVGFVADVYVDTQTYDRVMPDCSELPTAGSATA